ncbi:MAG: UDP-N-acetylglucosamine--N-acetylmuramyl-(pentapeptide) pyrophosphoryl-undecaprenol N-acetylglucosamine transferase [Alphaproteobacteria bacterium]|nr:MAG: UDP-N-acetylglucosamine--N-acetylmuramyl-(pentapeptide) pyrophosphoryl-undecaprenol N-acetylglucosamine transferase [Alphaproteobacteria bacterium]
MSMFRHAAPTTAAAGTILIAAGGTGGHVLPARVVAERLTEAGHPAAIVSDRRAHRHWGALAARLDNALVLESGHMTGHPGRRLLAMARVLANARRVARWMKTRDVRLVVGFGGYPSMPALIAARRLGIPFMLHEQNAVMGRVQRWFARDADAIALGFPDTARLPAAARARAEVTGTPLRADVLAAAHEMTNDHREGRADRLRLLICGGSLGARVFGERLPAALARLDEDLAHRLDITHQTPAGEEGIVAARYREYGLAAETAAFFPDLARRMAAADLIIARAGGGTLAEIAAIGRASILVPLPIAADDHQAANALHFARAGAARVFAQEAFTSEVAAHALARLLADDRERSTMAAAARSLARPHADETVVAMIERLLDRSGEDDGAGEVAR